MKKLIAAVLTLIVFTSVSFAQRADDNEGHMSNKKRVMLADALMASGSYYNAIDEYVTVYTDNKDIDVANKLAYAYFVARDYKNAEKWYKSVWDAAKDKYPVAEYYYALSLKYNAKYDLAKKEFAAFQKNSKAKGDNIVDLKRDAKIQEKGCDFALAVIANPIKVNIEHLNANVNHKYTDFSPVYDPSNNLVYASLAATSDSIVTLGSSMKIADNRIARIYTSKKEGDKWGKATVMEGPFNKSSDHTGNGAYSPDGKKFYFTECAPNELLTMTCKLSMSEFKNGEWGKAREVKGVNSTEGTTTTPTIGMYKGNEVLYFASNRPGGIGGMDIWYSEIKGDEYGDPKNVGRKINTAGNELTPFYSVHDEMLYFSSNGLVNIGGQDIYKTKGGLKSWDDPINVGFPLNSSVDDYYYSVSKNGRKGFLVSNRPGGFSVSSETCCDDIYEIAYIIPPVFAIMGKVFDSKTNTAISGANITLYKSSMKADSSLSSSEKQYYFYRGTEYDSYMLESEMSGYYKGTATATTISMTEDDTLYVDIYLEPIPIVGTVEVKNIFYELSSAELRPESFVSLDSLYLLLSKNPQLIVEFGSHTDYRDTDKRNLDLSQRRAQSVVDYLKGKGIDSTRMQPKGYGEGTPKTLSADFTMPSGKIATKGTVLSIKYIDTYKKNKEDYEALMQLNRRTEFRILGEIPNMIIKYDQGQIDAINALKREEEEKGNKMMDEEQKKLMDLQKIDDGGVEIKSDVKTDAVVKTETKTETKTDTKVVKAAPGVDPALTKKGAMYEGNALVNGVESTKYILNVNPNLSTAMVSKDFFIKLQAAGTVTDADFKNEKSVDLGNGTSTKGDTFILHNLQCGESVFENVECKINTVSAQNLVVCLKIIESKGCSIDAKNLKLKCK